MVALAVAVLGIFSTQADLQNGISNGNARYSSGTYTIMEPIPYRQQAKNITGFIVMLAKIL